MICIKSFVTGLIVVAGVTLLASAAGAAEPSTLVQALAGRYSKYFQNGMMDGEKYWSDDVVEIVPVADNAAYFRASLQFANGHACGIWGVATVEKDQLVYREPPSPDYPPPDPASSDPRIKWAAEHPCVLRLSRVGSKLQLDDGLSSCHDRHCGMRGMLTWALPFNSRRPISYMALLKDSANYKDALAEWRGDR